MLFPSSELTLFATRNLRRALSRFHAAKPSVVHKRVEWPLPASSTPNDRVVGPHVPAAIVLTSSPFGEPRTLVRETCADLLSPGARRGEPFTDTPCRDPLLTRQAEPI